MDEELRLMLLGKPQMSREGAPVIGFIYNKALALLAYLAVTRRPHSRETLAGLFWGEMPDNDAKANLRKILSALRDVAGPQLVIDRQTVAIDPASAVWLDTQVLETQLSKILFRGRGVAASAPSASTLLESDVRRIEDAVSLYRGDFLEGFYVRSAPAFEEWVLSERERLRQMALHALYRLVGYYTAKGDYGRGLDHATRLLALEPWHEEVHQQMMLLLALSGQRSAAMDQFETCRRLLANELGAEPNRDTMDLYRRIVRGELSPRKRPTGLPRDWPVDTTPFVGRAGELARLSAYLAAPDGRLATVVGIWYARKHRLPLWPVADACAPGIALGHVVGRMGCVLAGCCYGSPTTLPWGITFHDHFAATNVGTPLETALHPTQLYDGGAELLILVLLLATEKRGKPFAGRTFWFYMLLYAVSRFVIEFFRGDPRGMMAGVSTSQIISLVLAPISIAMLVYLARHTAPAADPQPVTSGRRRK